MWNIRCKICNKTFESTRPQYKYCSKECSAQAVVLYNKNYQKTHQEQIAKDVVKRHLKNPNQRKKFSRISYLNRHGVNEQWFQDKLKKQLGTCALCTNIPKRFHIDHDHRCCNVNGGHERTCGKCTRGLLCSSCNVNLGRFEETLKQMKPPVPIENTWVEKALNYIKEYDIV